LGLAEPAPVLPVDRTDQRQLVGEGLIGSDGQLRRDVHVDFKLSIQQLSGTQGRSQYRAIKVCGSSGKCRGIFVDEV
jgi:hypothetical protein